MQKLAPKYTGIKKWITRNALQHNNMRMYFSYVISKPNLDTYLGDLSLATFFSRYYTDIESARLQYEKETGTPVVIQGDTMLFLSRLALSLLALEIAQECGFEIKKHNGSYTLK